MKKFGIIGIALIFLPFSLRAREQYPDFDREYWVNEQALAKGKMSRGAGLGVLGLVSIWPATVMITRAKENPRKYAALGAVFGLSTLGATLHGFGSVGFGKKQKDAAASFIGDYDIDPDSVNIDEQRSEYLHGRRKTARKVILFGSYLTTISTILLTNGIVQSIRKGRGAEMNGIRVWPYYMAGGLLLTAGVRISVKSKRKLDDLDALGATASVPLQAGIVPFYYITENGRSVFGVSFMNSF
ncbi:MAG: hypothetical protein JW913_11980 [Chitinispirillaceae bacterium]|nr:hypothetical protein [Chitinispirillaceae bacterium]